MKLYRHIVVVIASFAALGGTGAWAQKGHDSSLVEGLDCGNCHTTGGWRLFGGTAGSGGSGGFDHAKTGFPLSGAHNRTSCMQCHTPQTKVVRECSACHTDAHKGRFGLACDECHGAVSWKNTRASRRHRLTRLPLTGMHALLDCRSCHIRTTENSWTQAPAECFACHEPDYRRDIHPNHQGDGVSPPFSRNCAECHRPTGWTPAFINPALLQSALGGATPADLAAHDARFPIGFGKHRGASCQRCHVALDTPRAVRCTGCHAHNGRALRLQHGRRKVATDGAGCLRCHPGGAAR
jgi:hypothetical protein